MPIDVVNHPAKDAKIKINECEYTALGLEKIMIGVENTERREVLVDESTGYNYARNAVETHELYNFKTKKHGPWFILNLETGARGPKSWFPGCIIYGDIPGTNVPIKLTPSDDSETVETLSKASVQILDLDAIDQEPYDDEYKTSGWYKVLYTEKGYIKEEFLTNLRYVDPTKPY